MKGKDYDRISFQELSTLSKHQAGNIVTKITDGFETNAKEKAGYKEYMRPKSRVAVNKQTLSWMKKMNGIKFSYIP
jgi:hypothetical protein